LAQPLVAIEAPEATRMKQRFHLEHLLYTSRLSFETVACSPGIDRRTRGQIERWASDYPVKRGDGRGAPLVVRAFPLETEDGAWGVMILKYTGGDMSRPEGNYLAHAFLIPGPSFRELGSNAAWIAAHVPFWGGYRSQSGAGSDAIDPVEVEIDSIRQLRFARLLLAEQGRAKCSRLLTETLCHLGSNNEKAPAFAIPFGPTPNNLAELLPLTAEPHEPPLSAPGPDVFSLWRMAGLIALLPRQFAERAIFSLNELEIEQRYRLTVLRTGTNDAATTPALSSVYVQRCLDCVQQCDFERFFSLRNWVERRLDVPSTSVLEGLTVVYDILNRPGPDQASDASNIAALLAQTRHLADLVSIQEFVLHALAEIERLPLGLERTRLDDELVAVIKEIKEPLEPTLLNALLARLDLGDGAKLRQMLDAFPGPVRARLFELACQQERISTSQGPGADREFSLWALESVAPHLLAQQEDLALRAIDWVLREHPAQAHSLERLINACDSLAPPVSALILQEIERRFQEPYGSPQGFVLCSLRRGAPSISALVKFVGRSRSAIESLLQGFPRSDDAASYAQFVEELRCRSQLDLRCELDLYGEIVRLVDLVTNGEQLGRTPPPVSLPNQYVASPSHFNDHTRNPSKPLARAGQTPACQSEASRSYFLGPAEPEVLRSLEARVCTSQAALRNERLRPLLLRHLRYAMQQLDVGPCLLLISAYADGLAQARCFGLLEDVLLLVSTQSLHVAAWLERERTRLASGQFVHSAAVFAKLLSAAGTNDGLDRYVASAIDNVNEQWRLVDCNIWDLLTHWVDPRALKRWRRLADQRHLLGPYR
jgi:hypothetical protein